MSGDTAFDLLESLLWEPDKGYWLLPRHLARMERTACGCGRPWDEAAARRKLEACVADADDGKARKVRLLMDGAGCFRAEAAELMPKEGGTFALSPDPVDSSNPFLRIKCTCRSVYTGRLITDCGDYDTLLQNERGELTEFTTGNLVIQRAGEMLTPSERCGLLAGTFREELLAEGRLREEVLSVDDLEAAEKIWLINSVRRFVELRWRKSAGKNNE